MTTTHHSTEPRRAQGDLRIEPGTWADYAALAESHYRATRPATAALILVARHADDALPAGVLVASMPVLNATWRIAAWGDRYDPAHGATRAARRLNAEVRTISRVIVAPAWRGLGVGSRLVRAYLAHPCTRRTEALAAMGRFSALFEHAGMRRVIGAPPRRDAALRAALRRAGLPAWAFADAAKAPALANAPGVRDAVRRWALRGKDTRGVLGACPAWELAAWAALRLTARPAVFVHERGN